MTQDSDPGEDLLDTVTFDRLQYTRELMETGNWITKQEGNGICIKYIMGSKFNPHLHVTWMEIDFGENLDIRLPFVAL